MAPTREEMEAFCPEAKAATDAQLVAAGSDAELLVDADTWGARYPLALKYMAAHLLVVGNPGLGGVAPGPVQSVSVGGISKSFAVAAGAAKADGPHASTRYGAQYDAWAEATVPAIFQFP